MDMPDVALVVEGLRSELDDHRRAGREDRVKEVLAQLKAYGHSEVEKAVAKVETEKASRS